MLNTPAEGQAEAACTESYVASCSKILRSKVEPKKLGGSAYFFLNLHCQKGVCCVKVAGIVQCEFWFCWNHPREAGRLS